MSRPNINIPAEFAINGIKTPFTNAKIQEGFDRINPDVLSGDNLNQFIDDTYKGLNGVLELFEGCVLYDSSTTYNDKSLVFNIANNNIKLYHSLQNGNIGNPLTDTDYWEEVSLGGNGNEVGDTVWRLLPSKDAGKHLLDGTLLNAGSYSGFVNYIADLYADNPNANYFTDEATWQATVAQYGACGKFVYDSTNNTLRLPKVTGIVEGTIDATALGDLIAAGLPNITGNAAVTTDDGALMTGAFSWTPRTNNRVVYNPSGSYPWGTLTLDASQSSPVYGNSSTVQPQTIKGYYYIVVATSTKTDIQVDIDEIATDLNGKADVDLTNTTNQAKILMSRMAMPSNRYIDLTLGASGATYTAPANGYIYWTQRLPANNGMWVLVNDNQNQYIYGKSINSSTTSGITIFLPVMKGYSWNTNYTGGTVDAYRFIYAQGSESEAS